MPARFVRATGLDPLGPNDLAFSERWVVRCLAKLVLERLQGLGVTVEGLDTYATAIRAEAAEADIAQLAG